MQKTINHFWKCRYNSFRLSRTLIGALSLFVLFGWHQAVADDTSFSQDPMETKIVSPPSNIMFLLDNSGSMDSSFMSPETQGYFDTELYLWDLGDNQYSSTYSLQSAKRMMWKSQWSGYNRIYYNQETTYFPWPRWNVMASTAGDPPYNADLKEPRSNPVNASPTVNLHNNYSEIITGVGVIVDNEDGSPAYVEASGSWNNSGSTPEWGNQSRWVDGTGEARYKPTIVADGDYQILAFWNCYTNRDSNALIKLDSDADGTADNTYRVDQGDSSTCGDWVPLFNGQFFNFTAGQNLSVSIERDASSGGDSTIADAILFRQATVEVKNAHYYTVDDNDVAYLVNFVWTDADSDGAVEDVEVLREYYIVGDDGASGNHESVTSLTPVVYVPTDPGGTGDAVPDSIQPQTYDEDGNPIGFISDIEDLQNYANWFSFYRRRELTAKAAVSRTIVDVEGVNVGFYTLHSAGGARQEVVPLLTEQTETVILDQRDSTATRSSWDWDRSGRNPQVYAYYTYDDNSWAKYAPDLDAGSYTVYGTWPCHGSSDENVKITINHAGGTTVKYVNQEATGTDEITYGECVSDSPSPTEGCCGHWVDLGEYSFDGGTGGYAELRRLSTSDNNSQHTYMDAFKFQGSGAVIVDRTDDLLDILYSIDSNNGTPLRTSLQNIGRYFDQDDNNTGEIGDSPYYSAEDGGACQQAFTIAMTDGYWNGDSPSVGNQDETSGAPYQDSYSNTLADVAMKYYDTDLADNLDNEVPTNNYDKKNEQHMVTFSVSFGLDGAIDPADIDGDGELDDPPYSDDPYFLSDETTQPTWPNLFSTTVCPGTECPAKIDDLWHAAVNGRGRFFSAKDPVSLVSSLKEVFEDIGSRLASGASVSVNGDELSTGLELYQSSYSSSTWIGNVIAYPINPETGEVLKGDGDIIWKAQDKLQDQDWDTGRRIITFDGATGIPFRHSSLSSAQKSALVGDPDATVDPTVVDYLRGEEIIGFRSREKKLGDIVHSAPLLLSAIMPESDGFDNDGDGTADETGEEGGTIYAGGNDGMLHAFNAVTGYERFAYMPLHSFSYLSELADVSYDHRFFVDATPSFKRLTFLAGNQTTVGGINYSDGVDNDGDDETDEAWEKKTITMLVGALKKGGRGIYALDVSGAEGISNGSTLTETQIANGVSGTSGIPPLVMWEYPKISSSGLEFVFVGDQTSDGVDNDGDGTTDEADENYSDSFDNDGDGELDEEGEVWLVDVAAGLAGDATTDGIDNDGDGFKDNEVGELTDGLSEDYSDNLDNDGDGIIDEADEVIFQDDDIGYTFSDPFIVRSSKTLYEAYSATDSPWIVVFGNGYQSKNGNAVLYVLDALSGDLLRKIDTGAGSDNGLSTPAVVDVDNDGRVDFVYAGDLNGNMWKFDLRDPDPMNWGVAYGTDNGNPTGKSRIDYADVTAADVRDEPKPLFASPGQPITTAPDVTFHCDKQGYMVVFGTGKFLGEDDREDLTKQTIYGIWDFGDDADQYLGDWDGDTNALSNLSGVELLEQVEIDWQYYVGTTESSYLRTVSDYEPNWYLSQQCNDGIDNDGDSHIDESDELCSPPTLTFSSDGVDNDGDGVIDETGEEIGHAGWFFDLPYNEGIDEIDNDGDGDIDEDDEVDLLGERVMKDVIIRDGKAIVISFIPGQSLCTGGGNSIVHELSACTGGRLDPASFDINGDGYIDEKDRILVTIDGEQVSIPPSGKMYGGMLHPPVMVGDPNEPKDREMKIFSSSAGTTEVLWETKEETGIYYWREH